ncbi:hypothetical protein QFC21_005124 [Naganishia friedmannii]|uniref:Uncharacterized protein n=1 Tax=Naganishia friedmannii TaxID=89922 RepID=A0ACC2VE03_9TREE|nr:hypothetical protein QFC21_005124 [Naganishia friedmannii]
MSLTLLVLYNASGTLLGHARYAYHHIRGTPSQSCAACALTHGPTLSLSESEEWTSLKRKLENGEVKGIGDRKVEVRQLHKEDLTEETDGKQLETVFTKSELDGLAGDRKQFEAALVGKMRERV